MARTGRDLQRSMFLHVLNRGNGRATVFHSHGDYEAFLRLLWEQKSRFQFSLFAFCLMPNHFHMVAQVIEPEDFRQFMQRWLTSHVRRYHRCHGTSGHVWQGRYTSIPVLEDRQLLTLLRYVLLNPVRAGLAKGAWDWPWSSLRYPQMTDPWPLTPPGDLKAWLEIDPGTGCP